LCAQRRRRRSRPNLAVSGPASPFANQPAKKEFQFFPRNEGTTLGELFPYRCWGRWMSKRSRTRPVGSSRQNEIVLPSGERTPTSLSEAAIMIIWPLRRYPLIATLFTMSVAIAAIVIWIPAIGEQVSKLISQKLNALLFEAHPFPLVVVLPKNLQ